MEKRSSLVLVLVALMMLVTVVTVINIALLLARLSVVDSRVNNLQRQITAQKTIEGKVGAIGDQGVQGIPGVSVVGKQGEQGAQGDKGDQGLKGDTGAKGATGDKGKPGEAINLRWNACLENKVGDLSVPVNIPVLEQKRTTDDFWGAVSDTTDIEATCQLWKLPAE